MRECCECGSTDFYQDETTGEVTCINCGIVKREDRLTMQERRAYTPKEISKRRQTEQRWRAFGPRTVIDHYMQRLTPENKKLYRRLSKIQNSLTTSLERNLWEAEPKLKMMSFKLSTPEHVKKTAWRIYRGVAEEGLTMGRSITGFVATSLYMAYGVTNTPMFLEELIEDVPFEVSLSHVYDYMGLIKQNKILEELEYNYTKPPPHWGFIEKRLELDTIERHYIELIYNEVIKIKENQSKDPKGVIAGITYFLLRDTPHKRTQRQVAESLMVTEVTLRTRGKRLTRHNGFRELIEHYQSKLRQTRRTEYSKR